MDGLTDLILETTVTNRSFYAHLLSLVSVIIAGALTCYDFVTSAKSFLQHTSFVSLAPVLIMKLFLFRDIFSKIIYPSTIT